jgi:N-acetylglucosaminyldiphosphoundecaprenol N-acetyl-beta-D-mannosaminyltransferase
MIDLGKRSLLGVLIDACDYEGATARILDAAAEPRPFAATALAVHGVVTAARDASYRARINDLDLVTPDGQPVRWALNDLHGVGLGDRVYGPTLARHVLAGCEERGLPVYFYGSRPDVLVRLLDQVRNWHPELVVAGSAPSQFRSVDASGLDAIAATMRESGARVVLVGLGCPRQEVFAHAIRHRVGVPCLAVGAAFDYYAGTLTQPPAWMQRRGLEWAYRLAAEPRRLWRRYLVLNPYFLASWLLEHRRPRSSATPAGTVDGVVDDAVAA